MFFDDCSTTAPRGRFDYEKFDVEDYDFSERVENGDMTWVVPGKFLAFAGPHSRLIDDEGFPVFTPEKCAPRGFRHFLAMYT